MDKREKLNPQIKLDRDPIADPASTQFQRPDRWTEDEISFYFDTALKVLNSDTFTTASEYVDMLVNQCLAEKHWSDAFTHFLTKVREMGLQIETDQEKYQGLQDRMFYWRTVRMMIHAAGLTRYEDEILKYEIAKFYQPPSTIPTLPPARVREVPNAAPRRKAVAKPKQQPSKPSPKPPAATRPPKPKV